MRPAVICDLDGTLIAGTSAERLLVPWLLRERVIGLRQLAAALALMTTLPISGRTRALRRNKRWLSGVAVAEVAGRMDRFIDECVTPRWNQPVIERVAALRSEGLPLFLLSGSPDFIVQAIGAHLGAEASVGSTLEVVAGRFTGRLGGPHWFGPAKVDALSALAREHDLDLGASWAFADHPTDRAFLAAVGRGVWVG